MHSPTLFPLIFVLTSSVTLHRHHPSPYRTIQAHTTATVQNKIIFRFDVFKYKPQTIS